MPHVFVSQDTVIYERLADSSRYKDITLKHLEQFATEGERQAHLPSICFLSSVSLLSNVSLFCTHNPVESL